MKSMDAMKQINALAREGKYEEARDHVLSLPEDLLLSFSLPNRIKAIELLRKPDKEYAQRALGSPEWLEVSKTQVGELLLQTLSECKSGAESKEDEKSEPKTKTRRRRRGIKLNDLDSAASKTAPEEDKKPDPDVEDAVEVAHDVGADNVEVEKSEESAAVDEEKASLESLVNQIQKENDERYERFVASQTKFSDGIQRIHEELVGGKPFGETPEELVETLERIEHGQVETSKVVSDTYKELDRAISSITNKQNALYKKIDRVYNALTVLGMWSGEVTYEEFQASVNALDVKDLD